MTVLPGILVKKQHQKHTLQNQLHHHTNLSLHYFQEILAPLYEGINVGKDAGLIQHPLMCRVLAVNLAQVAIGLLPELAAIDAFVQGCLTTLHVPIKDIIQRDLGATSLDNVTADLMVSKES